MQSAHHPKNNMQPKKLITFFEILFSKFKLIRKYICRYFSSAKNYFWHYIKEINAPSKKNFYIIILIILLFSLWTIFYQTFFTRYSWNEDVPSKIIKVTPGMNVSEIANILGDSNVISGTIWFKAAYKLYGNNENIKAGTYFFSKGMNNVEVLRILLYETANLKGKITIPEGARISLIARLAEKELNLSQEQIILESQNDSLINILGLRGKINNLEGFLFPDTYYLYENISEKTLIGIMFDEFLKKVIDNPEINFAFNSDSDELLSTIILASIVQSETGNLQEMPIVAGLYKNRLKKRMKLQADPTIQYVLPGGPRRLLNKDYMFDSEYNTYLHYGLPPGPICNPGLDAIKSVVQPVENDFLFMVADTNRTHRFAKSYQEHLKNISDINKEKGK